MNELTNEQKVGVRLLLWVGGVYVGYKIGAPKHPWLGAWLGGMAGGAVSYVLVPFDLSLDDDSNVLYIGGVST